MFKCTKLPSSSFLTLPIKWKVCVHLGIFLLKFNMLQFGENRRSTSCLSQLGSLQVLLWRRESSVYLDFLEQGIRLAVTSPLGIEMEISYGSPVQTREDKACCALFSKLSCLIRISEVCVSVLEACCEECLFPVWLFSKNWVSLFPCTYTNGTLKMWWNINRATCYGLSVLSPDTPVLKPQASRWCYLVMGPLGSS